MDKWNSQNQKNMTKEYRKINTDMKYNYKCLLLFSTERRKSISLIVVGSRLDRRCVTTCPAALNARSTAAELHGIAKDRRNKLKFPLCISDQSS